MNDTSRPHLQIVPDHTHLRFTLFSNTGTLQHPASAITKQTNDSTVGYNITRTLQLRTEEAHAERAPPPTTPTAPGYEHTLQTSPTSRTPDTSRSRSFRQSRSCVYRYDITFWAGFVSYGSNVGSVLGHTDHTAPTRQNDLDHANNIQTGDTSKRTHASEVGMGAVRPMCKILNCSVPTSSNLAPHHLSRLTAAHS